MQTKRKTFTLGAVIIVLLLTITITSTASAMYRPRLETATISEGIIKVEIVNGKEVLHEVSTEPSLEDSHWPIIYSETIEKFDEETGEKYIEQTVIRMLLDPNYPSSDNTCLKEFGIEASCTYAGPTSIQRAKISGNITAHIKHYAYYYCLSGDCSFFDPYKVERWWTRTNTNSIVQNATLTWGCSACAKCIGGDWTYVYTSSPITPGWNGLNSYVYITSIAWFETMQEVLFGGFINAVSNSNQVSVDAPMR